MNPSPENVLEIVTFPAGFFGFTVQGLVPGGFTIVTLMLHELNDAASFVRYGPSPDNNADHWEYFSFDGSTGVRISQKDGCTHVVFYFLDGQRGDDDLTADGVIKNLGGPVTAEFPGGGGGGGSCFISTAR